MFFLAPAEVIKCLLKMKERFQTFKYQASHVLTKAFKTVPLSGNSNLVTESPTVNDAYQRIEFSAINVYSLLLLLL
jgi:hypothetical protein